MVRQDASPPNSQLSTLNTIMKLQTALSAFLAGRFPAVYPTAAITTRINRSGVLDSEVTEAEVEKTLVQEARRWGKVEVFTHTDGTQYWSATQKGVSEWTLDGSPYIGD